MLENLYTTKMSGDAKILQKRFSKIRSKQSRKSKITAAVMAAALAMTVLFATVAMAAIDNNNSNVSSWAKNDIKKAEDYVLIYEGLNITDYKQNITRGMFCEIAANVFTRNGVTLTAWEYPFTDLEEDTVISSLYCMGIINGKTETEFKPNDYITREEAAAVLYRMYRYTGLMEYYPEETKNYRFADDEIISDYAKSAVYGLYTTHIMNGTGNDMFTPKSYFTIEQSISSMVRLYDILNNSDLTIIANNRARQDVRVFFSCFNQQDFEAMKNYCTQNCIDNFFGSGYVFGMTKAGVNSISFEPNERLQAENKIAVLVDVYMTPHEGSVFLPDQTETSFYLILKKQNDGSYLIDEFATGL